MAFAAVLAAPEHLPGYNLEDVFQSEWLEKQSIGCIVICGYGFRWN